MAPLWRDADLTFVDTRHEGAAVHMADGWGRLTGQVGVALVTAAPGHTNALTGVATALNSESPVLLISGGAAWVPWFLLVVVPWALVIARRPPDHS